MDRCWGIPSSQDGRLQMEITTETSDGAAEKATEARAGAPGALGKRHASTSPAGLDEVLGLCGGGSLHDGKGSGAGGNKSDTSQEHEAKPQRQRKHRKSTHVVRKEEKARLLKEMEVLSAQLESLKQQAMASMGKVDRDTARSIQVGRELRDDVQANQQRFGEVACIMSEFSMCNARAGSPLHDKIVLNRDRDSRRRILRALKVNKMAKAEHFLQLRRPNTNLRKICDEGRRFEMDNGDFFSERLTISQFKDAQSVKQIYDLLLFYYANLEISISEKIGHITVRLDDDNGGKSITQNRLVSTTIKDLKVESNTITFAQFHQRDDRNGNSNVHGDGDYGMIVMDYADSDEKYPYQPGNSIRKDVVAVMEIRECNDSSKPGDRMTVLTKWVQNKLHHPQFPVELKDWHDLRDRVDLFGKTMQRSLVEDLHVDALVGE
ncbi:Sulfatase protein [Phytophthora cinnamomi]|uniref:Sulfatase protein n=1 Tax=Phytophthora cinnamomi TaxID=4785 RepID=UPI003559E8A8|nr:Sulfatase protein [Phytophthora cinnamomi]